MRVNLQYAETHLTDLISAADNGEEIEIERNGKPALKLVVSSPPISRSAQSRILGASRGELRVPTAEEWKALDQQLEREMLDAPLTTTGEI